MLYNQDFLLKLDKQKHKKIFARITALTFAELPIEYIEGRVTQGSINLDGASALRRTCSLTMVAQDFDYSDYSWGLNTKFKLEIGVENTVDKSYPDIIWFNQGIYLITSFNTSRSSNNFSISISGKDKMCLLNGEVSGSIEASTDFGAIEEEDINGNWVIRKIPIPEIIRNAVHHYAGEPFHNIIINDLDTYGLELLEYRYDVPMYLYRKKDSPTFINATIDGTMEFWYRGPNDKLHQKYSLQELRDNKELKFQFDLLTDTLVEENNLSLAYLEDENADPVMVPYYLAKVEYGQTAGYRKTDLTYAGDLIANVGESITSVLDKIRNMLVEFEYFYDVDGRFVFQKKQSYIETMWNNENKEQQLSEGLVNVRNYSYMFNDCELISAFNNNPNLLNLKNDYTIWGERTTMSGAQVPVHLRYAIDTKPVKYVSIGIEDNHPQIVAYNEKYNTRLKGQTSKTYTSDEYDWRELIYQMALDYFKYNFLDDFELRVAQVNGWASGRTGYEQYYTDLQGFWRQLYNPFINIEMEENNLQIEYLQDKIQSLELEIKNIDSDLEYLNAQIQAEEVNENVLNDLIKKYQLTSDDGSALEPIDVLRMIKSQKDEKYKLLDEDRIQLSELENKNFDYEEMFYIDEQNDEHPYWCKDVYENPEALNFWFDFMDTSGQLAKFSVKNIGSRTKPINDTAIKSIYFRRVPSVIFVESIEEEKNDTGYRYIQIGANNESMFSISGQGKSAKDKLDELLYQHSYCIESSTITTIPIYYLQPNTRVYLHDEETKLDGDYIVSKITIPLAYNGTMSLTATKAAENII